MNKQKLFALLKKLNTTPPLSDLDFDDLIDDFITDMTDNVIFPLGCISLFTHFFDHLFH